MARAMWKGAIQFGLVTIPVKLYLATESKYGVSFHMLHEKDLSRIQMKIFCPVDEKVIPRGETVKGYEWAPDQYVVITDEDLEKVHSRLSGRSKSSSSPSPTRKTATSASSSRPTTWSPTRWAARRSTCSGRSSRTRS